MNNLAVCYIIKAGIEKNLEKAFYWYQKATENGYINAQCNLAEIYYNDKETEKAFY